MIEMSLTHQFRDLTEMLIIERLDDVYHCILYLYNDGPYIPNISKHVMR